MLVEYRWWKECYPCGGPEVSVLTDKPRDIKHAACLSDKGDVYTRFSPRRLEVDNSLVICVI